MQVYKGMSTVILLFHKKTLHSLKSLTAVTIAIAASSPILLQLRLSVLSLVHDVIFTARALAPTLPI